MCTCNAPTREYVLIPAATLNSVGWTANDLKKAVEILKPVRECTKCGTIRRAA